MKSIINAVAVALVLAGPAVSFAQSNNQPLTRAQVRADLERVEKAGYNPNDWIHYPENIQAAEARVAAQDKEQVAAAQDGAGNSVGGAQSVSESGRSSDGAVSSYSPPIFQHN
jgi:hypothetical protein